MGTLRAEGVFLRKLKSFSYSCQPIPAAARKPRVLFKLTSAPLESRLLHSLVTKSKRFKRMTSVQWMECQAPQSPTGCQTALQRGLQPGGGEKFFFSSTR